MFQTMNIHPVIPSKANKDPGTRLVEFDAATYRDRDIIERLIGWLKKTAESSPDSRRPPRTMPE